ncbi:MAG: hypothetical protein JW709_09870, partial [Sedimentisphaerales bacterium]|nr:hypothetical protein [Sedimentisphaerales bacterium]
LVTPYEATRAGFIEIALEKNRKATPFIEEAKALRASVMNLKSAEDLLSRKSLRSALLTAAGLSDKALTHLADSDKGKALKAFINDFLKPAGLKFVDELVYRFLLTRGDALGGMMRNIAGVLGERKFARSIISMLSIHKMDYAWLHAGTKTWIKDAGDVSDMENNLKGISWRNAKGNRILLFNITVPKVSKNVDMCLLNIHHEELGNRCAEQKKVISREELYLALGELKGGFDPAGADEHWKTANTALQRIRKAFARNKEKPRTFFVGAAIENAMAKEIWDQLKRGELTWAANLTNETQVFGLCEWLIGI